MPTLRMRFLGTLDIREDERPLSKPPTLKSQSLLAYLICHRRQPQPRERLIDLFWGDRPEPKARHSLATALWHIRRCLPHEQYIQSDSHTIQFDPQADLWLDVDRFEFEIAHHDVAHLESAVALYRGDFLDGFYDDWIINERYRLEALFSAALARLMVGQEASGEYEAALSTALRLLHRDPVREDAHRLAMRAYCRLGKRNAALKQYHHLTEVVKALFEAELIYLEQGVWRGDFPRISAGELPLPASLSEAIQARVDSLNDDVQEVLHLAAVLGREFDFDLLNVVLGRGEQATLEALDVLLRRRLLDEGSGAVGRDYAFTHHKIQEVVYSGMRGRRRQHAHARAGVAMENFYGTAELEALAGELAYHFEQGRELDKTLTDKAITYLLQAGDQARLAYAHQEASDYYQRALVSLKEQREHEQAARTLMKLGLTYHNAFDFRRARQAYEEGFALWQQAGEPKLTIMPPALHALKVSWPEPTTLDPAISHNVFSNVVIDQLFSGLAEVSPEMGVLPDLARTWEVSESGCKYVFHLRDDTRWSDGTPVTAGDFVYAWKRVLDPATASPNADLLYDIKGARAFHQKEQITSSKSCISSPKRARFGELMFCHSLVLRLGLAAVCKRRHKCPASLRIQRAWIYRLAQPAFCRRCLLTTGGWSSSRSSAGA